MSTETKTMEEQYIGAMNLLYNPPDRWDILAITSPNLTWNIIRTDPNLNWGWLADWSANKQ